MPIPSIDISYNEMLSSFIALPPLYRWNRYRSFGTDIVRNLAEPQRLLSLLFSRYFVSLRPRIASPALLEKCLSSSAFPLLDTRKSFKASAEERGFYFTTVRGLACVASGPHVGPYVGTGCDAGYRRPSPPRFRFIFNLFCFTLIFLFKRSIVREPNLGMHNRKLSACTITKFEQNL